MDSKILLSIEDAANTLSVSPGTIYNLIKAGKIERVKVGRAARITAGSIREYVASLTEA